MAVERFLGRYHLPRGQPGGWDDPRVRDRLVRLYCEERVRAWTNQRVRAVLAAGTAWRGDAGGRGDTGPGDAGDLEEYARSMPAEVRGMLRSRANTIEGGTSEVNRNVLAERVLGLAKEPDPWRGKPWRELPRS
jgi:alkylation response protein AidB-like acyl-CoA dehydrogenase